MIASNEGTTPEQLRQTWSHYADHRDRESRDSLIRQYFPLVRATARRIRGRLPSQVELDDLISSGTFGLIAAIEGFDPRRGARFETYCVVRVRGAILDELRATDWVPRLVRSRLRHLAEATQFLEARLSRGPAEGELARHMRISSRQLSQIRQDAGTVSMTSLDGGVIEDESGRELRAIDTIPDTRSEDPARGILGKDLVGTVTRGLRKVERLILLLYYHEAMSMKEISLVVDLSESRVSQMHSAILSRLRQGLEGQIHAPSDA